MPPWHWICFYTIRTILLLLFSFLNIHSLLYNVLFEDGNIISKNLFLLLTLAVKFDFQSKETKDKLLIDWKNQVWNLSVYIHSFHKNPNSTKILRKFDLTKLNFLTSDASDITVKYNSRIAIRKTTEPTPSFRVCCSVT